MGLFSGGLGGLIDGLISGGAGKKGEGVANSGRELSNKFAGDIEKLGTENYDLLKALGLSALGNANNYKQDATAAINASNENFENSRGQMNSDLAAMGYSPSSNSAYAKQNAALSSQKAQMQGNLQNQANAANLAAQQQALGLAGNMYNSAFGNQFNAMNAGYNAKMGANNALAAYYANKYNQGMGLVGAGLGAAGAAFGGPAGALAAGALV